MPKPITLTVNFKLPKGHKVTKASIQPDGEIILTDNEGNTITPEKMERTTQYPRNKGPKIQSRSSLANQHVSVGGVNEFMQYDSVFAIDTNTRKVNDEKISVACFICCNFISEGDEIRIDCDGKLNIYEFHDIPENVNPEMVAIHKVTQDIIKSNPSNTKLNIAFITDTDMESHDKINARDIPIYQNHLLPMGTTLHYASTDTGRESTNRLIKFCDKQSSNYLQYLEEGAVKMSELTKLEDNSSIKYRFMFRTDLEIVNPVITGPTMQLGTKVSLYGVKDDT